MEGVAVNQNDRGRNESKSLVANLSGLVDKPVSLVIARGFTPLEPEATAAISIPVGRADLGPDA